MSQAHLDRLSALVEASNLPADIDLECRHFFSGASLYANGAICVALTPVGLAVKLHENTRNRLLSNKIAIPLKYFANAPIKKEYVLFPRVDPIPGKMLSATVVENINYVATRKDT